MRLMYTSILQRALTNRRVFIYIHLCTSVFFPSSRHLHENCYSLFFYARFANAKFFYAKFENKNNSHTLLNFPSIVANWPFSIFFLLRLRVNIKQRRDNFCNSNIYCMYIYIFYSLMIFLLYLRRISCCNDIIHVHTLFSPRIRIYVHVHKINMREAYFWISRNNNKKN